MASKILLVSSPPPLAKDGFFKAPLWQRWMIEWAETITYGMQNIPCEFSTAPCQRWVLQSPLWQRWMIEWAETITYGMKNTPCKFSTAPCQRWVLQSSPLTEMDDRMGRNNYLRHAKYSLWLLHRPLPKMGSSKPPSPRQRW
jgi:hypothetical protein